MLLQHVGVFDTRLLAAVCNYSPYLSQCMFAHTPCHAAPNLWSDCRFMPSHISLWGSPGILVPNDLLFIASSQAVCVTYLVHYTTQTHRFGPRWHVEARGLCQSLSLCAKHYTAGKRTDGRLESSLRGSKQTSPHAYGNLLHGMATQDHDTMDHSVHDGSESTPNSPTGDGQGGLKAAKDKSCPFCGQPFTSSSLGRHLDLYIKPKNPKAPDGVHDVDKIRQMRGGITRRQPRASQKGHASADGTQWDSGGARHRTSEGGSASGRVLDRSPVNSPVQGARGEGREADAGVYVNAPSWLATGVINNLPARAPSRGYSATPTSGQAQRAQEMRKDSSGNRTQRPEYGNEDMWKLQETAEVGRAAELALREVLGSLEAAKKKAEPLRLFDDIEFCQLTFAGLCLALLPPPPTLFSTTPFALAHTWPLSPPGEKQYTAMQRVMSEKVATVRNGNPDNLPDSTIFRYQVHLQGAWEHWQLLSEHDKFTSWNLEVSRAFVKEKEKKANLQSELDQAHQRIKHLEAEYDRLSRCQLPREYLLYHPRTMPVSSDTMREMRNFDTNPGGYENDYDADALICKWKNAVRATARPNKPPVPRQENSTTTPMYISEPARNPLRGDMMMSGSVFGVNGPMPRGEDVHAAPRDAVQYETPDRPGGIVGDGEEEVGVGRRVGDPGNGRRSDYDDRGRDEYRSHAQAGALTVRDGLNVNGKRPFAGTPTSWGARDGGGSGANVAREMGGRG